MWLREVLSSLETHKKLTYIADYQRNSAMVFQLLLVSLPYSVQTLYGRTRPTTRMKEENVETKIALGRTPG